MYYIIYSFLNPIMYNYKMYLSIFKEVLMLQFNLL